MDDRIRAESGPIQVVRQSRIVIDSFFGLYLASGGCILVAALVSPTTAGSGQIGALSHLFLVGSAAASLGFTLWGRLVIFRPLVPIRDLPAAFQHAACLAMTALARVGNWQPIASYTIAATMTLALHRPRRAAVLNALSAAACFVILALGGRAEIGIALLFLSAVLVMCGLFLGQLLQEVRNREVVFEQAKWASAQFAIVNARLQESIGRTEIWTRTRERKRIAREIHDTIGYSLTAVLAQLNAARQEVADSPAEAGARLDRSMHLLRATMQDVRNAITNLRETDITENWISRYESLALTFAESTGIQIHSQFQDGLEIADDELGETIYKILQESITNAYRHGRADYIDIAAGVKAGNLLLRISDNGRGAARVKAGSGLEGIRERVGAYEGETAWETADGRGFHLGVSIPVGRQVFHGEYQGTGGR